MLFCQVPDFMGYDGLGEDFRRGAFRGVEEFDGLSVCSQLVAIP
jgi:hypothetical protein